MFNNFFSENYTVDETISKLVKPNAKNDNIK